MVLWISSAFIVVRLLYRIIELTPGMDSSISASEACFYLLGAVPLLLAVSPYAAAWPSNILPQISHKISSNKSEPDWPLATAYP
ncbi:hypothetical protein NDA16_000397 [Ustilago loliicola]|nr:hypothetical protein NDA16_000397 [Ustilago loliicola]